MNSITPNLIVRGFGLLETSGGVNLNKIRIFVAGACGKMGMETVRTILKQEDMEIVGVSDIQNQGKDIGKVIGIPSLGIEIDGLINVERLQALKVDLLVDFTNPQSVFANAKEAIKAGVVPVIGATGLDEQEIGELEELAGEHKVGVFIAPNFALGAILLMKFAKETAKFFQHVEIIE